MSRTTLFARDPDFAGEYILPDEPGAKARMMKPRQAVELGLAEVLEDGRTTQKIPLSKQEQRLTSSK